MKQKLQLSKMIKGSIALLFFFAGSLEVIAINAEHTSDKSAIDMLTIPNKESVVKDATNLIIRTLPKSRAYLHWVSVRFYETGCI